MKFWPECALQWRAKVLDQLPQIQLTLVLGQYALAWHLKGQQRKTLTETVSAWRDFMPARVLPMPHPSPRNIRWFKTNPWFEADVIPVLRGRVKDLIG